MTGRRAPQRIMAPYRTDLPLTATMRSSPLGLRSYGKAAVAATDVNGWREHHAALSRDSQHQQNLGLLKDAVRFVPELAPRAGNAQKEPDADHAEAESADEPDEYRD